MRISQWMRRYRVSRSAYLKATTGNQWARLGPHEITCSQCAVVFISKFKSMCPACAESNARRARRSQRLHGKTLAASRTYRRADIFERDGYRCHLAKTGECIRRGKVRLDVHYNHSDYATIDHLIPLSQGGTDSPDNVATAHRACNTRRNTRGHAQLRLLVA